MTPAPPTLSRPVRILAAGGTISMQGERAVPTLDARGVLAQLPRLQGRPEITAETVLSKPGAHLTLADAFALAGGAVAVADGGEGVVVSTGTDTLEELAVLCSVMHGSPAPVVLTGANRPASAPGADGPANLLDAITVAGAAACASLGTIVVFGGEIHDAMTVRKLDSTGPAAFASPSTGPIGRVLEGRVWLHSRPDRGPPLAVAGLPHRVDIVTAALGDDGALLRDSADRADGLVVVAFGAGHLSPGMLGAVRDAAARLPVVVTGRPERSSMLFATYGFEGSEADVRASGAVCAPFLSPVAARVALLACLGAGLQRDEIAATLAPWDAA